MLEKRQTHNLSVYLLYMHTDEEGESEYSGVGNLNARAMY